MDGNSGRGNLRPQQEQPPNDDTTICTNGTDQKNPEVKTKSKEYAAYLEFEDEIIKLDEELHKLSNKAREIGSSVGILSASTRLNDRLANVLYHLDDNATMLFPRQFQPGRRKLSRNRLAFDKKHRPVERVVSGDPDSDDLLPELQGFAQDIATLLECFSHFSQFRAAIPDPPSWVRLRLWAEYLENFRDEYSRTGVQVFLHESLEIDLIPQIRMLSTKIIPVFIEIGIPTVKNSQDHSVATLSNLTTVSTFFSGVTASMLQLTWGPDNTMLNTATNTFWLVSLVLSTSSAVYSLLGLAWTQAIFRSPDHHVPWWVGIWMRRSPLFLLVLSMACFFVGLVLFTYTTRQATVESSITLVLSSLCCVGLVVLSLWFAFEQWTYSHYHGHKWLAEVLAEWRQAISRRTLVEPGEVWRHSKDGVMTWILQPAEGTQDAEKSPVLLICNLPVPADLKLPFWSGQNKAKKTNRRKRTRHRWREAYRRICEALRRRKADTPDTHENKEPGQRIANVNDIMHQRNKQNILPKLDQMHISHELLAESTDNLALVHVVRFSPDGKSLLVSRFDKKAHVFTKDSTSTTAFASDQIFDHPDKPNPARRFRWSPDGRRILLSGYSGKSVTVVAIKDGGSLETEFRALLDQHKEGKIRAIAWAGNDTILSVIEQDLVVKDLRTSSTNVNTGTNQYHIGGIHIQDIAVTEDSKWMVCIGASESEPSSNIKAWHIFTRFASFFWGAGTAHGDAPAQHQMHQLALYCLETHRVVLRASMFRETSHVALTPDGDGYAALLSFKDESAPQLWQLNTETSPKRCFLRHTYRTRTVVGFEKLPSVFGGPGCELVLRAGLDKAIHIWDRSTAEYLRSIELPSGIVHLTALSWNHEEPGWMFATGTQDGRVQIWTAGDQKNEGEQPKAGD